jgi:hypothetical protein
VTGNWKLRAEELLLADAMKMLGMTAEWKNE